MRKVAVLAIVAAVLLGGTATAASRWVITSTHQIKPSVLKHLRGKTGPRGATGPAGAAGPAGGFSTANVSVVQAAPVNLCPSGQAQQCNVGGGYASCPPGAVALAGGWSGPVVDTTVGYNYPIGADTAWDVIMDNESSISESFTPYVVCAASTSPALRRQVRPGLAAEAARNLAAARATAP